MRPRFCINGRFLARPVTGVDRFAREVVRELDRLVGPGEASIAVPECADEGEYAGLVNIEPVRFGFRKGLWWEQVDFPRYLAKECLLGVNLCNTAPIRRPGVVCVHDMAVRANPDFFDRRFVWWCRLLLRAFARRAEAVLTVSDFSRREIGRYYPRAAGRIAVVPDAWQHMGRVEADRSVFGRHPGLESRGYYFAMSSLAPNKNLEWLVETAALNPGETVAVAGGVNERVFGKRDVPEADNVVYLGYVSDGEAKALIEGCKGFLYPTFYEGFGIPPMEALACGAKAAVSDTEVMREVYGDAVAYVDPARPCGDLEGLFSCVVAPAEAVLSRYSWRDSAERLLRVLGEVA